MTAPRFVPAEATPDAFAGLVRASRHPAGPVPDGTLELVALRVSLRNGCAFCCDLHHRRAEAAASAAAVSAWNRLLIAAGVAPDPTYG